MREWTRSYSQECRGRELIALSGRLRTRGERPRLARGIIIPENSAKTGIYPPQASSQPYNAAASSIAGLSLEPTSALTALALKAIGNRPCQRNRQPYSGAPLVAAKSLDRRSPALRAQCLSMSQSYSSAHSVGYALTPGRPYARRARPNSPERGGQPRNRGSPVR